MGTYIIDHARTFEMRMEEIRETNLYYSPAADELPEIEATRAHFEGAIRELTFEEEVAIVLNEDGTVVFDYPDGESNPVDGTWAPAKDGIRISYTLERGGRTDAETIYGRFAGNELRLDMGVKSAVLTKQR